VIRTVSAPIRRFDPRLLVVALGVLLVDQASKAAIVATIGPDDRHTVVPGVLTLVHYRNAGIAGGHLSGTGALVIVVAAVALVGVLALVRATAPIRGLWIPTGLILGGGLGNLLDRVRSGAVTDFLRFGGGDGAANLADQAIMFGVVTLLVMVLLADRRKAAEDRKGSSALPKAS
jgi:signal peptidase II